MKEQQKAYHRYLTPQNTENRKQYNSLKYKVNQKIGKAKNEAWKTKINEQLIRFHKNQASMENPKNTEKKNSRKF